MNKEKYEEEFYKKLYSYTQTTNPGDNGPAQMFHDDDLPKVSETEKLSCDITLTIQEVGKALKELQNGKAPGTDGFTPDFYKLFWPTIKNTVFESLTYAYDTESSQLIKDVE